MNVHAAMMNQIDLDTIKIMDTVSALLDSCGIASTNRVAAVAGVHIEDARTVLADMMAAGSIILKNEFWMTAHEN